MERHQLLQAFRQVVLLAGCASLAVAQGPLRAGAAKVDVTPTQFPVIVNCMFNERSADKPKTPLHARALVLNEGSTTIAIVVVDSCMMPRELIDQAKALASKKTGIPPHRMLISATHAHSAPAVMACLGSRVDTAYAAWLPDRIAAAIVAAKQKLAPARIGWAAVDAPDHTHTRRWIFHPDKMLTDPFGVKNVRANMHPGYQNPNVLHPSGPSDTALSLLSVQTPEGKPRAVLANYSQHYFGDGVLSADYFGLFSETLGKSIKAGDDFVAMMSQGTSGDQMWMDYGQPKSNQTIERYTSTLVAIASQGLDGIEYHERVPLKMEEAKLSLKRRIPDAQRLAWARDTAAKLGDKLPVERPDIYAREAIYLHEDPKRELKLQAIRIGELGITAIPNEVYAITGLKLKQQSPLDMTFNIELANGAEGYIPPPEQHQLGGYTTWPARTAGLEVQAEPKIVETLLKLLEKVAGEERKLPIEDKPEFPEGRKPVAYWRLNEISGDQPKDVMTGLAAKFDGMFAWGLDGHDGRAPYLAGARLKATLPASVEGYVAEYWVWDALGGRTWQQRRTEFSGSELSIGPIEGKLDEVSVFAK
ncbi:MAG: hypothetical protein IT168_17370 [Bryobacterales bacterium]|nr:hypothetical protein [Bryobacterales bacterium]